MNKQRSYSQKQGGTFFKAQDVYKSNLFT